MGANLPFPSLQSAVNKVKPDYLLTFLVAGSDQQTDEIYIQKLTKTFPSYPLFISAAADRLNAIPKVSNVIHLHSPGDLKSTLQKKNATA
jgi:hypothetical protein